MESINSNKQETSIFEPKIILRQILAHWYLFVIAIIIGYFASQLYIRYSQPIYSIKSSILIKDQKGILNSSNFLKDLPLASSSSNLVNEMEIIKSFDLIKKAVVASDFYVSYFVQGVIKTGEIYKKTPFIVYLDTLSQFQKPYGIPFYFEFTSDSTYTIYLKNSSSQNKLLDFFRKESSERIFEVQGSFGIPCKTQYFTITVQKTVFAQERYSGDTEFYFKINNIDNLVAEYSSKLKIETVKGSTILGLSTTGTVPEKEIDFLNQLCNQYIQKGLDEKNQDLINTINFIDEQLLGISDSLKGAENQLERFRKSEKLVDIGELAQQAYEQVQKLEEEKAILLVKDKYYKYLYDYLNNNQDIRKLAAPSAVGIGDPLLTKLIDELYNLYSEQTSLGFSAKEKNPSYNIIELKIQNTKKALVENLKSLLDGSRIALNDNAERLQNAEALLKDLPSKERNLIKIKRKYNLNDNIYNYLLEKRTEASIAKAANTPDNKVINKPMLTGVVFPNTSKIKRNAIMLAIFIPFGIVLLRIYLNDTISSKDVIIQKTNIPIIGTIGNYKGVSESPLVDEPKSRFSESIRSLRVSMQYIAAHKANKVIGVTSSVSGEGKTFFATNLGTSIALSGAKVVLLGADLRKPKLHANFNVLNDNGLSSYLINKSSIEDIIHPTQIENLDLIPSGPVPPNPTELLESKKIEELIEALSIRYEYIIIDAPPFGLVADYYILSKFTHINLYLLRQNYSKLNFISNLNSIAKDKKLNNLFIVFNDVKYEQEYGYGYNYGYGYYEEKKPGKVAKVKGLLKKWI